MSTMTDLVTFVSVNLRGAQLAEKRKDVLNFLKQKRYSIYFLQDTHFTKQEENYTFYKARRKLYKKPMGL